MILIFILPIITNIMTLSIKKAITTINQSNKHIYNIIISKTSRSPKPKVTVRWAKSMEDETKNCKGFKVVE